MPLSVNPVLVEVLRGDTVESRHRGAAVVVDSTGRVVAAWGDVERPAFPRSAAKPLQALALVESGAADRFALSPRELALAAASHSGTPEHTATVEAWLHRIGLGPGELECAAHDPIDQSSARALIRAGRDASSLHNNCSGKHSGFLTVARHLGVPNEGYLRRDHPVQRMVTAVLGEMTGCDMAEMPCGIDGCGIPAFALPLRALAHGMARLADPSCLTGARADAARRIVAAMAAHPFLVAGPDRFDTEIMTAIGSVIVKGGAEGVEIAIVRDRGLGLAVKMDDGAGRGAEVAMASLLHRFATADLRPWLTRPVLNVARRVVGVVRPV